MKVYYELEKSFAEDLQSDAQALEIGMGAPEVGERLAPLQAAIKAFDDLTDEEQAAARRDRDIYEAMLENKSSNWTGIDTVNQQMFLMAHPHITLLENAEEAQEELPEVMAEYQSVASNTFFNQSNVLVAQVTAANGALDTLQRQEVSSLAKWGPCN